MTRNAIVSGTKFLTHNKNTGGYIKTYFAAVLFKNIVKIVPIIKKTFLLVDFLFMWDFLKAINLNSISVDGT